MTIIFGLFLWPLLEYGLHRFLGHELKYISKFKIEHGTHHAKKDYFASISYKIAAAIPSIALVFFISWIILGHLLALAFTLSFIITYAGYEVAHFCFHKIRPLTKWGSVLRKHHFSHHFMNPRFNHGVTTTLFDRVFGTYRSYDQVVIPKSMAMDWLFDAEKPFKIRHEYQKDYRLS